MMAILADLPALADYNDLEAFRVAFGTTYRALWNSCQKQVANLNKPEDKILETFFHLVGHHSKVEQTNIWLDILKRRSQGKDLKWSAAIQWLGQDSSDLELELSHFTDVFGEIGEDYYEEYKVLGCSLIWADNHFANYKDSRFIEVIQLAQLDGEELRMI